MSLPYRPPQPMPQVQPALLCVRDMQAAAERASGCWNVTQMRDALRSVRYFLEKAEAALPKESP